MLKYVKCEKEEIETKSLNDLFCSIDLKIIEEEI